MHPEGADTRRPPTQRRGDQYTHGFCPDCQIVYRWPRGSVPLKHAACPFHHRYLERVHKPHPDQMRTIIRPPTYFLEVHK